MVRALDRAVLEAARRCALRPMELYALLLLRSEEPLETTVAGRELADAAANDLEQAVAGRMAAIDPALRVLGTATLADLTLPTSA